jgi:uncharacterized protein
MHIDITNIGEDGLALNAQEPLASFPGLSSPGPPEPCEFTGSVIIAIRLSRMSENRIRLHGRADAPVRLTCSRCLSVYTNSVRTDVDLTCIPFDGETDAGDDDTVELSAADVDEVRFDGVALDVAAVLQEEILAALPIQPLCDSACKGLCPRCGANRNTGACGGDPEPVDPRLAALKQWKQAPYPSRATGSASAVACRCVCLSLRTCAGAVVSTMRIPLRAVAVSGGPERRWCAMAKSLSTHASRCLRDEKVYLEDRIRECDYCASSYEESQKCRVVAAKEGGARSRGCLL